MSDTIAKILSYAADLGKPVKKTYIDTLFATEDNAAHRFDITLLRNGAALSMPSGTSVSAYLIRYSDNATVSLTGSVSGNVVSVTLSKACYSKPGQFALIIKATTGSAVGTVFYAEGTIYTSSTDTIVDQEHVVPSLSDLLAQIDAMEAATQEANTATANANTATGKANTAASNADKAASSANKAASGASGWANATMTATALATGSAPTATVTTASDGHKVITVGIPRGNTGATPQISVEVATGAAGSEASVSVSGTAENPVVHLTIPRGDTGAIENLTINGKPVESGTITLTASDVGARPDTWMPSASDVGARPDTWMPSASDVGARPDTWMPSASDVGARALNAVIAHEYNVTLTASGWTGSAAPYTQTVSISGILATDSPIADLDVSGATADSYSALAAAWACVGRITTQSGKITATCYETKPTVDMTVRLMAVR